MNKKNLIRLWKILCFKLNRGFSCTKCGGKSDFNHVHFDTQLHGRNFIFENNTKGICADCTQKELNQKARIVYTHHGRECQWCRTNTITATFINSDRLDSRINFGSNSWNGQFICQDCMNAGIDSGKHNLKSSIMSLDKKSGLYFFTNELGIKIPYNRDKK